MPDICLYAQVHQPYRLRRYRFFDIGSGRDYFDDQVNREVLHKVAHKCYVPTNRLLAELVERSGGSFRLALSISGTVLEQLARWEPRAMDSFHALVATGGVELLAETSRHSLAALADDDEFEHQVEAQCRNVELLFGRRPTVFRNTELIFSDAVAASIRAMGFRAVLVEGADHVLGWRSPNYVYESAVAPGLRLLPRNYALSDDVGFRFSNRDWDGWPLTADKYAAWIAATPGDSIHLFLDYETFGEHQWADTGIFDFLRHLPHACSRHGLGFVHPSSLAAREPVGALSYPHPTSWADVDRSVTAWLGNGMQWAAHTRLYRLRDAVLDTGEPELIEAWRRLTTSDHLYYMCTKWFADGDVHKYFSPYDTPYDAFIAFMNVLQDLEQAVAQRGADRSPIQLRPGLAEMACVA